MVSACLVDVWDTLVRSEFDERFAIVAARLGIEPGTWQAEWFKGRVERDHGKLSVADSFDRTLQALGIEPRPEVLAGLQRLDRDLMREVCRPFHDTVPFLSGLRERGIKIALVSNCSDTTRGLLDHLGLIQLVDSVILSCEIGTAKPFPEIYRAALDDVGVAAADAAFIDDQPAFCAGAEAAGIRPIQLARGESGGHVSQWGFPVARSLLDAASLL